MFSVLATLWWGFLLGFYVSEAFLDAALQSNLYDHIAFGAALAGFEGVERGF